jgi:hypothetical protein
LLTTLEAHYDLKSGRYLASLLEKEAAGPPNFALQITPGGFFAAVIA